MRVNVLLFEQGVQASVIAFCFGTDLVQSLVVELKSSLRLIRLRGVLVVDNVDDLSDSASFS